MMMRYAADNDRLLVAPDDFGSDKDREDSSESAFKDKPKVV